MVHGYLVQEGRDGQSGGPRLRSNHRHLVVAVAVLAVLGVPDFLGWEGVRRPQLWREALQESYDLVLGSMLALVVHMCF